MRWVHRGGETDAILCAIALWCNSDCGGLYGEVCSTSETRHYLSGITLRRIPSGSNQFSTLHQAFECIQLEKFYRCAACRSQTYDIKTIELEVIRPIVSTWIKQRGEGTRIWID